MPPEAEPEVTPDVRLRHAIAEGSIQDVSSLLADGTVLQPEHLSAAAQSGHVETTHYILCHCRGKRFARPLDRVNSVCNVMNWAASGYCSAAGPAMISMLVRERHIDALRKGPLDTWHRLSALLDGPGAASSEADDYDDVFTNAGRAAVTAALRVAVPPSHHATWASARARRPGAAKLIAAELVSEQIRLIAACADRVTWAPNMHVDYPPRFRALVRVLLLCSRRPECPLSLLGEDLLMHLISVIAERSYWSLDPPPNIGRLGAGRTGAHRPVLRGP
jgi:hypothetical protein